MSKNENLKILKRKYTKKKVYKNHLILNAGLNYKQVKHIIDSLFQYYHYNSHTGFIEIEMITTKIVKGRTLSMSIFIGKGLTSKKQEKILMNSSFQYDVFTGILNVIHKVIYT